MKAQSPAFLIFDLLLASLIAGFVIASGLESYKQVLAAEQRINQKNNLLLIQQRISQQLFADFMSIFIPQIEVKPEKDALKEEADSKQIFFELINENGPDLSATMNKKLATLDKVSFCCSNASLDINSAQRASRVTYVLTKSAKSTDTKPLYDLQRLETKPLWRTPNKKELKNSAQVTVLENVTDFIVSGIKVPKTAAPEKGAAGKDAANKEPAKEQTAAEKTEKAELEQVSSWGQKTEEEKTLPLAVIIKATYQIGDIEQHIDLFLPVLTANTKQPETPKDDAQKKDGKTEEDKNKPQEQPPMDNQKLSGLDLHMGGSSEPAIDDGGQL